MMVGFKTYRLGKLSETFDLYNKFYWKLNLAMFSLYCVFILCVRLNKKLFDVIYHFIAIFHKYLTFCNAKAMGQPTVIVTCLQRCFPNRWMCSKLDLAVRVKLFFTESGPTQCVAGCAYSPRGFWVV